METTQGISLLSCIYFKLAGMSCFPFYLLCFFFYKIGEQEGRSGSAEGVGRVFGTGRRGETAGKGVGG
jgi:hypothetical protein